MTKAKQLMVFRAEEIQLLLFGGMPNISYVYVTNLSHVYIAATKKAFSW